MQISLIVAMSENRVIGQDNQLPWHLPNDLRHFKDLTQGHAILMGRKTFQSIGRPLPNRMNIVITRDQHYKPEGVIVVHTIEDALRQIDIKKQIFVIGGGDIYTQFIDRCSYIYLTMVSVTLAGDVFFPKINPTEWEEVSRVDHSMDEKHAYDYSFIVLKRIGS